MDATKELLEAGAQFESTAATNCNAALHEMMQSQLIFAGSGRADVCLD
jgi:hypothetical protein